MCSTAGVRPDAVSSGPRPRFAARCTHLRVTMGAPGGGLVNICRHIVREGRPCVGPFLDDTETACGLWERKEAR